MREREYRRLRTQRCLEYTQELNPRDTVRRFYQGTSMTFKRMDGGRFSNLRFRHWDLYYCAVFGDLPLVSAISSDLVLASFMEAVEHR